MSPEHYLRICHSFNFVRIASLKVEFLNTIRQQTNFLSYLDFLHGMLSGQSTKAEDSTIVDSRSSQNKDTNIGAPDIYQRKGSSYYEKLS